MYDVIIYCDGSSFNNNNKNIDSKAGYGGIIICNGKRKKISGSISVATNNQAEIIAAMKSIEVLNSPCNIKLYTDSQYLIGSMTGNKRNANKALLANLDKVIQNHKIEWIWVRGHVGNPDNEEANTLAQLAAAKANIDAAAISIEELIKQELL